MTNGESQNKLSEQTQAKTHDASVKKTVKKLMLIVFGMFGFGFAMVPLYDVFCDITGLNGKTSNVAASYNAVSVDTERTITVQFLTRTAKGIPWRFNIVGQAVPSVSPGRAAVYFQKIECFCFNNQPLKASEDVEMGLQFYVDVDLPDDVSTITLSYTLYDITSSVDS